MRMVQFEEWHLPYLKLQPAQEEHYRDISDLIEYGKQLNHGIAWTGIEGDTILGCGGFIQKWKGVAVGWTLLSGELTPRLFLQAHRFTNINITVYMTVHNIHRLETTVKPEHEEGRRWLRLLDFKEEAILRKYGPDGNDYIMAARINE